MELKKRIEEILEGQNLDSGQISEIMDNISEVDLGELDPTTPVNRSQKDIESELLSKFDDETDWRKKAKIAARIISSSLE